jgi:maltooligosyltrehalose trehalohydrolase
MTTWSCEVPTSGRTSHGAASIHPKTAGLVGATYLGNGRCQFRVWAPRAERVEVRIVDPRERRVPMERMEPGYHQAILEAVEPGSTYLYRLDGKKERPDPASKYQPSGVHKSSQVIDLQSYRWKDDGWRGLALEDYVFYELHVGTFSATGTFDGIVPQLEELKSLGITAIELMPVAQFPGDRNWGYDGVCPFAVQNSYGGPDGLMRLVDECHQRGMAVVLDVVYNHLGPEGNYLGEFGPYFTGAYRSPWGQAVNFDGEGSDDVVNFFIQNALYWVEGFHIDALRLDAIHGIVDRNARPFLEMLACEIDKFAQEQGRKIFLIAETDLNDARFVLPRSANGYGLHGQWNDDFHHAVHTLLTSDRAGYYQDFGSAAQLAKAFREGYVYTGEYSRFRQRRHGNSSRDIAAGQMVVFTQNHDQVGNRMLGERLSLLVSFEALKLCAGLLILSPYLPLLFMGEEYGENAPFLYFTSHSDPDLIAAVRHGRKEEFAAFGWQGEPPDPQYEVTFRSCKLNHELKKREPHRSLLELYGELLRLRRSIPALSELNKEKLDVEADEDGKTIALRRWTEGSEVLVVFNLSDVEQSVRVPATSQGWQKLLDSSESQWKGPGSKIPETLAAEDSKCSLPPTSFCLFSRS